MATRREFLAAGAALALAAAGARAALLAGRDYVRIAQPLATESGAKVEVLEFFWYGCPHCFDLEPLIERWLARLPADAAYRRVPAIFNKTWETGAKLYYTLDALGLTARLHRPVFDAIHKERIPVHTDEKAMAAFLDKHGVDRKRFQDTWASFAVGGKLERAKQLTRASRIEGVPALIVDGRYLATGPSHDAMMKVVDELIAQVRAERARK
ncbi:MAG: thiol:disulfide interchange protein DsbA [Rhodocyclaceae bacterium]